MSVVISIQKYEKPKHPHIRLSRREAEEKKLGEQSVSQSGGKGRAWFFGRGV